MKYGVHVRFVVHGVENGTGDVGHALGYNPSDGRWRHAGDEGLKGYEHAEAHQTEAEGFDVAVFLQVDKADDGACDGCSPYESEECPAPCRLFSQCYQGDG